jgi:hypothetical protein
MPVLLMFIDKDLEILFQFLVNSLCLPVSMRVVCGGVDKVMPRSWYSSQVNSATNCGPWLDTTLCGRPCNFQTFCRNSQVAPRAVVVVVVGMK